MKKSALLGRPNVRAVPRAAVSVKRNATQLGYGAFAIKINAFRMRPTPY